MIRPALVLALTCSLASLAHAGAIYRWVDARGQVHYSETPPASIKSERQANARPPSSSQSPPPAASTPPAGKEAVKAPDKVTPAAPDPALEKAERTARLRRCTEARAEIALMEEKTAYHLGVPQPDGSIARMTEEEFNQLMRRAREEISKICGP